MLFDVHVRGIVIVFLALTLSLRPNQTKLRG